MSLSVPLLLPPFPLPPPPPPQSLPLSFPARHRVFTSSYIVGFRVAYWNVSLQLHPGPIQSDTIDFAVIGLDMVRRESQVVKWMGRF